MIELPTGGFNSSAARKSCAVATGTRVTLWLWCSTGVAPGQDWGQFHCLHQCPGIPQAGVTLLGLCAHPSQPLLQLCWQSRAEGSWWEDDDALVTEMKKKLSIPHCSHPFCLTWTSHNSGAHRIYPDPAQASNNATNSAFIGQ